MSSRVSRCRCCTENEKRDITRDDIYRGVCVCNASPQTHTHTPTHQHTHPHTHTLWAVPQTPAITQMWREEAITRDGINRSGRHAHTCTHFSRAHTLSPVRRGDAVAPRIGSVQREPAGGKKEKWKEMNTD